MNSATNTLAQRVIRCIAEQLGEPPEQIHHDHELVADIGCDSLDLVELAMLLEAEFDIDIDDDHFGQLTTVQQVIDHVSKLTGVPA